MLFVFIFFGAIALAFANCLNVKYIRGSAVGAARSSTFVLGGSFLAGSVFFIFLWLVLWYAGVVTVPTAHTFWLALAATITINVLFEFFRFRAYALTDLGVVAPFGAIAPVLTIVTGWFLLKEIPTIGGTVGIMVVAASIYLLHLQGPFTWKTIVQPLQAIWLHKGTRYAFLSSVPPAVSIIFDKQAVAAADPISFATVAYVGIGLGAWGLDIVQQGWPQFKKQILSAPPQRFLAIGFFHFLASVAFTITLLMALVPYISALRRTVIIFEILFGYLLLHQRTNLRRRLYAGAGVVAGVLLIAFFR